MRPNGEDEDEEEDDDDDDDARPEATDALTVRIAPRATMNDDLTETRPPLARARVASRRVASTDARAPRVR